MDIKEFKVETGLEVHNCPSCGINYAVPTEFIERRRKDHENFYCPSGHPVYCPRITKEEILAQKLESCKISNKHYQEESRYYDYKARHWKGKVTKIQKAKEVRI